jgi:hypothetical protein
VHIRPVLASVHIGGRSHQENWIPAADLPVFDDNIVGAIEVIHEFRGSAR